MPHRRAGVRCVGSEVREKSFRTRAKSLFGAFCADEDDVEARGLLFYSLWIGNHFIAADHRTRRRADAVRLALARLEA